MRKLAVALLLYSACMGAPRADTAQTQQAALEHFMPYAGAPVAEIRSFRFYNWRPLGPQWFALWTRPNDGVYLIRVEQPCPRIDDARTIGISSTNTIVDARFDRVSFDVLVPRNCGIAEIRPVDFARMKADDRAAGRVTPR